MSIGTVFLAVVHTLFGAPPAPSVDVDRFLESVAAVACTDGTPLGRYDVTRKVWHDRTTWPYRLNGDRNFARVVALRHLAWLRAGLRRAGVEETPRNLACCWRLGLEGGKQAIREASYPWYANNVSNVYEDLSR